MLSGSRSPIATATVALILGLPSAVRAQVVINEVLYDSPGDPDGSEFVELTGPPGASLDGLQLVGIDGATGGAYRAVDLGGQVIPADGYFVVTNDGLAPYADLVAPGNWQNGPDEIELQQGFLIVDSVCYGSTLSLLCEGGAPGPLVPEGSSVARCPDGADTDMNADDFLEDDTPTPGAANDAPCGEVTPYTTCELRQNDLDGVPIHLGERVQVFDIVALNATGVFRAPGAGLEVAVTDRGPERTARGGACCLLLFDPAYDDALAPIGEGDGISEVVGTVGFADGVTLITDIDVLTLSATGLPLDPIAVTSGDLATGGEAYESCLVQICGVVTVGGDPWPSGGGEADVLIDDGTSPVTMRIDADTDASGSGAPIEPMTVLGIAGQDDPTPAHDGSYLLRPRRRTDVMDDFTCPVPIEPTSWGHLKSRYR